MAVTQVRSAQILDDSIVNADINSAAAIASTKLATWSANRNAGSNRLVSLADPTAAQDAATKAYVDSLAMGLSWKDSVRAASTAAGTLATDFENLDVIDGITLATGDRILIKDQVTAADNGIYTVNASGAPTRAVDADVATALKGAVVPIEEGTTNANRLWMQTGDGTTFAVNSTWSFFAAVTAATSGAGLAETAGVLSVNVGFGTDIVSDAVVTDSTELAGTGLEATSGAQSALRIAAAAAGAGIGGGAGAALFLDILSREVPTGTINGVNVTFTLANTPSPTGSEQVYLNGLLQNVGGANDYTISGVTITFNAAPLTGDVLLVTYFK